MITGVIVIIGFLLLCGIASSAGRAARNSRRVPCRACGEPLLVNSTICPRCHGPGNFSGGILGAIDRDLAARKAQRERIATP